MAAKTGDPITPETVVAGDWAEVKVGSRSAGKQRTIRGQVVRVSSSGFSIFDSAGREHVVHESEFVEGTLTANRQTYECASGHKHDTVTDVNRCDERHVKPVEPTELEESIALEQIRTTQRAIDLLKVVADLVNQGMSSSEETYPTQRAISQAITALKAKRNRELDTRLTWQRRDWLGMQLHLGAGATGQRPRD